METTTFYYINLFFWNVLEKRDGYTNWWGANSKFRKNYWDYKSTLKYYCGFRNNIFDDVKTKCNLAEFIRNTINSKSYIFDQKKITVVQNLDENIEIVTLPNSLQQSILNILINSIEALELVQTSKYIIIDLYLKDETVYIVVKDNGKGIEQSNISKVFEPYFTTKHKKQGIGLGLTNVYNNIVTNLDGKIKVENIRFEYDQKEHQGVQVMISLNYNLSPQFKMNKII